MSVEWTTIESHPLVQGGAPARTSRVTRDPARPPEARDTAPAAAPPAAAPAGAAAPARRAKRLGGLRWLAAGFIVAAFFDSYTFSQLRFAENFASLVGLLLLLVFLAQRGRRIVDTGGARGWFIAFLIVSALEELTRFFILPQSAALRSLRLYLQYAQVTVLYLIFADLARDPRVVRFLGKTFVACVLGMSLIVNVGFAAPADEDGGRIGVSGIGLNMQAFFYAIGFVILFSWLLARWPRLRLVDWALVAGAGSMLVAAAKTGSRGGAGALLVGVAVAAALSFRQKKLAAWVIAVPLGFAGIAAGLMSSEVLRGRAEATITQGDTGYRLEIAEAGWSLAMEDPLVGRGGSYVRDLGASMQLGRSIAAHNAYLQIILSFGLIGFLPWIGGVAFALLQAWRSRAGPWGPMLVALSVSMTAFAFVANLAHIKHFWILLAVMTNAAVMLREPLEEQVKRRARQAAPAVVRAARPAPARGRLAPAGAPPRPAPPAIDPRLLPAP